MNTLDQNADTPTDSTVIDEDAGNAAPAPSPTVPDSRDDAITKALDAAEQKTAPVDEAEESDDEPAPEKAKEAKKPEADKDDAEEDEGGESDPDEDEEGQAEKPARQREKKPRPTIPAPEKFMPEAKQHWPSVPHVVRADIDRVIKEYEGQAAYYRPVMERYESIREFDEMAARNGVNLRDSLAEVSRLEGLMGENPVAALNQMLLRAGPRKADGQPVSLFEMASAIVQMGQDGYHKAVTHQPQQQQRQPDPEVVQMREEMAQMKADQTRLTVLQPFAQQNPRFNEPAIQGAIAQILRSDMVAASLPAQERLAAAYDMAVRLIPDAEDEAEPVDEPEQAAPRRVDGNGGSRSIRGAPPSGSSKGNAKPRRVLSRDDAINAAMAALR